MAGRFDRNVCQRGSLTFAHVGAWSGSGDRRPPAALGLLFSVSGLKEPALRESYAQPLRNILLWHGRDVSLP
jgi:hypothetical protein